MFDSMGVSSHTNSITFLALAHGDNLTIQWDGANDEPMVAQMQILMESGVSFFKSSVPVREIGRLP